MNFPFLTRRADPVLVDRLCELAVGKAVAEEALHRARSYRGYVREPRKDKLAVIRARAAMTERLKAEVGE